MDANTGRAKIEILGSRISPTSYSEVCSQCKEWVDARRANGGPQRGRYVCITSVHGVMTARRRSDFLAALNGADIATPDGMPLVWALRSFGVRGQTRVYGPDLMLALCRQAALDGHRIFLYGGREETLPALTRTLAAKFPGIQIAGSYSPPFRALTPEEDAQVIARIIESRADVVFVGISTPKQEFWMQAHQGKLGGAVLFGVGAAFDFHAGRVRQAPRWIQGAGLEWLFRLAMEPGRLWRRYLLETPLFLPLWAMQRLRMTR